MQLISLHSGRRKGTLIAVALLVAVSIQWLPLGAGERGDGRSAQLLEEPAYQAVIGAEVVPP